MFDYSCITTCISAIVGKIILISALNVVYWRSLLTTQAYMLASIVSIPYLNSILIKYWLKMLWDTVARQVPFG